MSSPGKAEKLRAALREDFRGGAMATVAGEIAKAKKELMLAAAARWAQRAAERDRGLDKVARLGPGAADSTLRQIQFAQREAQKAASGMPMFGERVIGTRDFVAYAPSAQAGAAATPVARITTVPDGGYVAQGVATGLLLPGSLLLTNYHVFPGKAYAVGFAANFRYAEDERGVNDGVYFELDPAGFFHSNAQFDFAIVAVKPKGLKGESLDAIGATRLIEAPGKVLVGSGLNIIQHPLGGPRKFAISNNRLVDLLPEGFLHYETDTEPGSSGAPVYSNGWELVALHHSAVPRLKDGRIQKSAEAGGGDWDEAHDPESAVDWVANEGIRVSRLVDELRQAKLEAPDQQQRLDRLLAQTTDPFESTNGTASLVDQGNTGRKLDMAGNVFNFSGPVTLHVYAPQPLAAPLPKPEMAVVAPTELLAEKQLVFDPDYEHRHGYAETFLGIPVPLPTVVAARRQELYQVRDYQAYFDEYLDVPKLKLDGLAGQDALVLPYHHYSLVFNKAFRMCMWTASNCDYRPIQRQDTRPRKELGGENWRPDPRVPADLQLKDEDVYGPGKKIDRGHIVRREDNCWGAVGIQTDYANSDTYHWTNCTPQHEAFNQENPTNRAQRSLYADDGQKGIWGQFESAVADEIEAGGGRAILFAGPVLKDFFASIKMDGNELHIPKKFWKVVVVPDGPKKKPKLLAYGYVFSQVDVQKKYGFGFEGLELPRFSKNRIKLADLSAMTGVIFSKVVLDAEQA